MCNTYLLHHQQVNFNLNREGTNTFLYLLCFDDETLISFIPIIGHHYATTIKQEASNNYYQGKYATNHDEEDQDFEEVKDEATILQIPNTRSKLAKENSNLITPKHSAWVGPTNIATTYQSIYDEDKNGNEKGDYSPKKGYVKFLITLIMFVIRSNPFK